MIVASTRLPSPNSTRCAGSAPRQRHPLVGSHGSADWPRRRGPLQSSRSADVATTSGAAIAPEDHRDPRGLHRPRCALHRHRGRRSPSSPASARTPSHHATEGDRSTSSGARFARPSCPFGWVWSGRRTATAPCRSPVPKSSRCFCPRARRQPCSDPHLLTTRIALIQKMGRRPPSGRHGDSRRRRHLPRFLNPVCRALRLRRHRPHLGRSPRALGRSRAAPRRAPSPRRAIGRCCGRMPPRSPAAGASGSSGSPRKPGKCSTARETVGAGSARRATRSRSPSRASAVPPAHRRRSHPHPGRGAGPHKPHCR